MIRRNKSVCLLHARVSAAKNPMTSSPSRPFDESARRIKSALPAGRHLVVIGSTSFHGPDSHQLCTAIGSALAPHTELTAVTGGMEGVQATFSRSFAKARLQSGSAVNLFHLLPVGMPACREGVTLSAGTDFFERREILGRIGHICLVIEGGPGTQHEATVAAACEIPLLPLGRSGGCARTLYSQMTAPPLADKADWTLLNDHNAPLPSIVDAVVRLTLALMSP
jgi:hypothetical protein